MIHPLQPSIVLWSCSRWPHSTHIPLIEKIVIRFGGLLSELLLLPSCRAQDGCYCPMSPRRTAYRSVGRWMSCLALGLALWTSDGASGYLKGANICVPAKERTRPRGDMNRASSRIHKRDREIGQQRRTSTTIETTFKGKWVFWLHGELISW